jgi:hypothetical protein
MQQAQDAAGVAPAHLTLASLPAALSHNTETTMLQKIKWGLEALDTGFGATESTALIALSVSDRSLHSCCAQLSTAVLHAMDAGAHAWHLTAEQRRIHGPHKRVCIRKP